MKAAIINRFDAPPQYGEFAEPVAKPNETIVTVSAAALSPLVKSQASGQHYSSNTAAFPFIPGVDGVGKLYDGSRVYFAFPRAPYGSMAERAAVQHELYVPLPVDLDDATAAAVANPGMSSWAALTARAKLVAGETVLINGATGSAGRMAVQIAKHLGAKKVIATGRNQTRLDALAALGADVLISLEQSEEELAQRFRQEVSTGVDVILDYLWGKSSEQLIAAVAASSGHGSRGSEPRIRFIQIGAISGSTISLPAAALRSSGLELLGSGLGSLSNESLVKVIGELMGVVIPAKLSIEVETVPLTEVEAAWTKETGERRLVFTL